MSGFLTTHVLDTSRGCPASGLVIELYRLQTGGTALLAKMTTNSDGRTDEPILPAGEFETGAYELRFNVGEYFAATAGLQSGRRFLDVVPVRFEMAEDAHYHVPLLVSPYGYSTYRGS